ncbi:MAG: ankyrin repeat domain-containing protein [Planctomycetota bacterium]
MRAHLTTALALALTLTARAETPLIEASIEGDTARIAELLRAGDDVNEQVQTPGLTHGWTPLAHAVRQGHADAVRTLLDAGAELTSAYTIEPIYRSQGVVQPLIIAAQYADLEIVRMLVDAGGDFTAELNASENLLHLAARNDEPDLIPYFVNDLGIDPNAVDEKGRTPMFHASRWETPTLPDATLEDRIPRDEEREVRKLLVMLELLAAGCEINRFDNSGFTPLLMACMHGTASQVRFLLEHGAVLFDGTGGVFNSLIIDPDADGQDADLRTIHPVALGAAFSGDAGVLSLLAQYNADLNATDSNNRDLLEVAVSRANNLVIPELIGFGFDPDAADRYGRTHLMHACIATTDTSRLRNRYRGHVPTARALIEGGADLTLTDEGGRTALHYAAGSAVPELVELLLASGADPLAEDLEGRTPLDYTATDAPRVGRYPLDAANRAACAPILEAAMQRARAEAQTTGAGG